jgi:hypothetical protein
MKYCEYTPWSVYTTHHLLFNYGWTQLAGVLHFIRLARVARDKHFSFLGLLLNYEENDYGEDDHCPVCIYNTSLSS